MVYVSTWIQLSTLVDSNFKWKKPKKLKKWGVNFEVQNKDKEQCDKECTTPDSVAPFPKCTSKGGACVVWDTNNYEHNIAIMNIIID